MSKYKDADRLLLELSDLLDEFSELDENGLHNERWCGIMDAKCVIVNAPSIDIEPKQGEWIVDEGGWKGLDYYPPKCKCNQCGYEEELYIIHSKPTNYCPNCGCQMKVANDEQ